MPSSAIRSAKVNRKIRTYLVMGAVTLIILLVTLATAGREQTLRCDRLASGEVDCVVRQTILGVITLSEKSIAGAQAVSIGQQCVEVDCKYRLEVYAIQGLVPVNEQYTSNYDQLQKIKDDFNSFFTEKSSSYVQMKEETNPILMLAVVVVFLLIWIYLGYLIWQVLHPSWQEPVAQS
ncbi:MAG: hypothetical protein A2030_01960 [Chloroflexi bacterium RBG_19FT_COMBO_50_10]|nr:MAG: hypothetical protein A2030_01960 [Chloroflexi bacterium RBG_19FT_COMBO_50_10]